MAKTASKSASKPKRLIVLDTHAILHRAYHALPEFSSSKGMPTGGLYGLISMLLKIINDLKPDYIVAAIDLPGGTYRHAAYKEYKGTRKEIDEALISQLKEAPGVLKALGVPVYSAKGFEADDVIGTIVEKTKKKKDVEVVIASGDMDTMQLVDGDRVRVFTLKKGLSDTILYDEKGVEARYGFGPTSIPDYKGLRGDPSDNIKGVMGVGEKTATILISEFESIENLYKEIKKNPEKVLAAGCKEGMLQKIKEQEEEAKFSKMLAEIRRDAPIEFELPKDAWREGVDSKAALEMLAHFDFRALVPRVRKILGTEADADSGYGFSPAGESLGLGSSASGAPSSASASVPAAQLAKAALAVWVMDSSVTNPTLEDVLRVGKSDDFGEAQKNILAEIKKRELNFVLEDIEEPLMPVLRAMESRGVKIDKKYLKDLSVEYHKELDAIAGRVYKHAGGEFNINSPKQLGDVLFDTLGLAAAKQKKTSTGQRSTRESELEKLRDQHEIIPDILMHRELSKLLGTYIDTIPELLDKENRLHTTFIQMGTSTGRLGSENPNVQNIPIKTDNGRRVRNAFVASEGFELVSFDYSQIELRIAALITGDKGLREIFESGRDAHTEVASRVFGVDAKEVNYDQRRIAKVINFGILYGMGVGSLQQALGTSRAEAQEFYNHYFMAFPKLGDYMQETKAFALKNGYTTTYFGRRRYFDGIKSPIPYVKAAAERMAINAPIQGTSADLIKLAMVKIAEHFKKEKLESDAYMLLQVHDELVFEIKKNRVKDVAPKIKEIMECAMGDKCDIPIATEGKHGKNWGEMQKLDA